MRATPDYCYMEFKLQPLHADKTHVCLLHQRQMLSALKNINVIWNSNFSQFLFNTPVDSRRLTSMLM